MGSSLKGREKGIRVEKTPEVSFKAVYFIVRIVVIVVLAHDCIKQPLEHTRVL